MLKGLVGRDEENGHKYDGKYSSLHGDNAHNHDYNDGNYNEDGGDLALYACSDHVSTVRAYKVGQRRLSKGGFCHSNPLWNYFDLKRHAEKERDTKVNCVYCNSFGFVCSNCMTLV